MGNGGWRMAKWRWGADDGRCAETRQRATLRDRPPPPARHTTRTTRTTTRTTPRARCSWPPHSAYSWATAPSCCGGLLQRLVCRFEGAPPQRASTQGLAWPRDPIGCRPQEPASQQPLPLCARFHRGPSLRAAALLPCCPAAPSPIPAAKPPSGVKTTSLPRPRPACSCSCSARSCASGHPPTPNPEPFTRPFRLRLRLRLRLSPCTLRHPPSAAFALHAPSLPPLPFPSRSTPQTLTRFNFNPLPVNPCSTIAASTRPLHHHHHRHLTSHPYLHTPLHRHPLGLRRCAPAPPVA
jgi:hypothetical protein